MNQNKKKSSFFFLQILCLTGKITLFLFITSSVSEAQIPSKKLFKEFIDQFQTLKVPSKITFKEVELNDSTLLNHSEIIYFSNNSSIRLKRKYSRFIKKFHYYKVVPKFLLAQTKNHTVVLFTTASPKANKTVYIAVYNLEGKIIHYISTSLKYVEVVISKKLDFFLRGMRYLGSTKEKGKIYGLRQTQGFQLNSDDYSILYYKNWEFEPYLDILTGETGFKTGRSW